MSRGNGFHVIPLGDWVKHELVPDCICGPDITPEEDSEDPQVINFIFRHHALDGRKQPNQEKTA